MIPHVRWDPVPFKLLSPPTRGIATTILSSGRDSAAEAEKGSIRMHDMMGGGMTGMMWGMGLIGLIVVILIVLGIAALVKYLFFTD